MNLLITGAYRSGTTLLSTYLDNLPQGNCLNQEMTDIFIQLKKLFYKSISIESKKYLGIGYPRKYLEEDFEKFLSQLCLNSIEELHAIGDEVQQKDWNENKRNDKDCFSIFQLIENALLSKSKIKGQWNGFKEILLHEFIPYLLDNDFKVVVIIRNPKDMLKSLNFGKGHNYTGYYRPTLLNLHNWREMAEMAIQFANNPKLTCIKFEEFISSRQYRRNFHEFLDISYPLLNFNELYDKNGKLWIPNSSFGQDEEDDIKMDSNLSNYIEAICYKEMKYFNYNISITKNQGISSIKNFKEPWVIHNREYYTTNFSEMQENKDLELERLAAQFTSD